MSRIALYALTAFAVAAPAVAAPTTNAPDFVKQAGSSDLYEKTSSQMVMKDAKNPKVKQFAQMMVSDHNKSTADIMAAAKTDGLKPGKPKLLPEHAQLISQLKAAKPADREKVYVQQQVTAHEQALALHQTYSQGGDKPNLKAASAKVVPVVQQHLTEVRAMSSSM